MHMSPAAYVIHVFKGVSATARAIGRDPSTVSKWTMPKEKRGLEGNVPRAAQRAILEQAQKKGLDITPTDLIYGRTLTEQNLRVEV
jgi:amino-acid N-acetyltransferase